MKNKKITWVLSLLAVAVLSGCSSAKQAEQIDTQNETINAQTEQLNKQNDTIDEQTEQLHSQSKVITVQNEELNSQDKVITVQNEQINTLVNQLSAQEKLNEYIVKKGDTLLNISRENQVSVDTLVSLNLWLKYKGINVIFPNDVIKLK